jgi:6-phosphogluconolactonase (cycloisomerase 2 family)
MGTQRQAGMAGGGHLYMQTNETQNTVVHYRRHPNGTITEVELTSTSGAGSGTFKPISDQESAPNSCEVAASVILTPDRRFLFATNGGANSVSSFAVDEDGRLTWTSSRRETPSRDGAAPPNH